MKYRDPKTGEVFADIKEACDHYCSGRGCDSCAFDELGACAEWAEAHPAEAARLMGLEIITDKEESMEKKDRPRICQVLGGKDSPLEVGEVFTIRDYPNRGDRYAVIHTDGKVHNYLAEPCQTTGTRIGDKLGSNALYWLIEHPDRILRKSRFTQEEVADAKALMRILGATGIERAAYGGNLCAVIGVVAKVVIEQDLFPSLRPGQAVRLEDVLEGKA